MSCFIIFMYILLHLEYCGRKKMLFSAGKLSTKFQSWFTLQSANSMNNVRFSLYFSLKMNAMNLLSTEVYLFLFQDFIIC